MEYVDGESLAQRIKRGPVPPTTALRWAVQIAGALDAAHRRGIVHRDLKPANVMISGQLIKLLDFGLAKLRMSDDAPGAAVSSESTISLSAERSILGTLHYMAPEQLEGRDIDPRTDLFALGAVLVEMLTARKAFEGSSDASVMAAILTAEPQPVSASQTAESIPLPGLDRVVRRALAKDPDERWQTARDLMNELQWILEGRSAPQTARASLAGWGGRKAHLSLAALAAVTAAVLIAVAAYSKPWKATPSPLLPVHLSFLRPAGQLTNTGRPVLTISPDGTKIVFNANNQLYIRRLETAESVPINGTQGTGVRTPFFSPDGQWVAFFLVETGELKKIAVNGGVAVTICRALAGSPAGDFGASWTNDNQILYATGHGVFRVPAGGGTQEKIIDLKTGEAVHGPQMLPDGDHVLLTVTTAVGPERWDKAQIVAHSLSSGARTVLIDGGADARYLDTGDIVYAVGTTLFAVPVDVRSLRIAGPPVPVVQDVRRAAGSAAINTAAAFFAVSRAGDLAYIPAVPDSFVETMVDLDGQLTPLKDAGLQAVRVSPDGSQIVAVDQGAWWVHSLTRRAAPRSLALPEGPNTNALWTLDGTHIVFRSRSGSGQAMIWRRADGTGSAETLLPIDGCPIGWSRDGKVLFYLYDGQLWSWTRGQSPRSLIAVPSPYASLSPDRQWVAFHTSEHGRVVPYIQSVSSPAARFQISQNGHAPLWSPDGRKLFYVAGETNSLMTVDVQTAPTVVFGKPAVLVPEIAHGLGLPERWYDVAPDGRKLFVRLPDKTDARRQEVDVVLHWSEELKRRMPAL
jgi:serine/threonine-protein kinase